MKVRILLILLNFLVFSTVFCQTLKINLNAKSDTLVNTFTFEMKKPVSDINWITSKFKTNNFTTDYTFYLQSIDKTLGILVGQNELFRKYIVFDKNLNYDFSDDTIIYFEDTLNSSNKGNYKTFYTEIKNKEGITSSICFDYTIIKPKALRLGDSLTNKFFFAYRSRNYYSTEKNIEKKKFYFYIIPKKPLDFTRNSLRLFVSDSVINFETLKTNANLRNGYRVGDKIKVSNDYYFVKTISSNGLKMELEKIKDDKPIGVNVGFYLPNFSFKTIENKSIVLSDFKTKFLLLEFWGTWCGPCKSILPGLKSLYDTNKEKNLSIVSIAYNDKIELVKAHKEKYNLEWIQVLNKYNGNADFSVNYEIIGYPSFILLDATGKIVFRDSGINGFDNLKNFIDTNTK